jgi:hypothetical protein
VRLIYRTGNNFQIALTLADFPALKAAGFTFATSNEQSHMTALQIQYLPQPWEDVVAAFRRLPKTDADLNIRWDYAYLMQGTQPAYYDRVFGALLAGITGPEWNYVSTGHALTWNLEIGLHWDDKPIPAAAEKLIALYYLGGI